MHWQILRKIARLERHGTPWDAGCLKCTSGRIKDGRWRPKFEVIKSHISTPSTRCGCEWIFEIILKTIWSIDHWSTKWAKKVSYCISNNSSINSTGKCWVLKNSHTHFAHSASNILRRWKITNWPRFLTPCSLLWHALVSKQKKQHIGHLKQAFERRRSAYVLPDFRAGRNIQLWKIGIRNPLPEYRTGALILFNHQ